MCEGFFMPDKITERDAKRIESDIKALKDAGYDTSDVGTANNTMTEADVAKLTGTSSSKAAHAAHEQRTDSGSRR